MASAAGNMMAAPMPCTTRKMISHVSAEPLTGVAPHRAEATAKTTMPMSTIRRWPRMSLIRPPRAKVAASANRYPLMTHWTALADSASCPWMLGTAIETMV